MSKVPLAISLAAGHPGTSTRIVCPKCNGGSDSEKSMSVWHSVIGDISYRCFRSNCGIHHGTWLERPGTHKTAEPKHYTRPYKALNDAQAAIIHQRFDIPSDVIDGYSEVDDRFILGVSGPQHQSRGVIAYSLSGGKPKALTYNAMPDEPFVHWAGSHYPKAIIVVEDWFSAEKVREAEQTGVSICGTNLTINMVIEIAIVAGRLKIPVYIALDKDAFEKAVGYLGKYREQFGNGLFVWSLERDLKYVSVEEIKKAVTDGVGASFSIPKGSKNL